ncbi:hypothetical protein [Ruminococcus flavefaciens]|uniref:HNH endonuclease n=1 Tax=Ruminococcus flavefaciens TaxID=1265 RepID=A0A1M7IFM6_RUMFL|nr:hypothetical protein [Ruminococcus flavefaciens]SHM39574.1 hypothetical protein SAMN04487860_10491 [Ruminococcus flavefaciens]
MIKINLSINQIERINSIIDNDIDSFLWKGYNECVLEVLRSNKLTQTLELIGTKEKLKENCKIFGRKKLLAFGNKVKTVFEIESANNLTIKEKIKKEFTKQYTNFSHRACAYEILSIINASVCPYCNRLYTFTVEEGKKTRPEFDHFYSKDDYPWLAISIYNLIPSCGICNKSKSSKDTINLLYPYEESFEEYDIHFNLIDTVPLLLDEMNIKKKRLVKMCSKNADASRIINKHNNCFKLEDIYNEHREFIIDLIKRIYIFNDDCIESIYQSYNDIIDDIDDLRSMSLGTLPYHDYLNTPLAKLTNDLIEQMLYDD